MSVAEAASDVSYEQIHYEGTFFRATYYIFSPFVSTRWSAVFAGLLPRLLERLKIGFSLEAAVCDSFPYFALRFVCFLLWLWIRSRLASFNLVFRQTRLWGGGGKVCSGLGV